MVPWMDWKIAILLKDSNPVWKIKQKKTAMINAIIWFSEMLDANIPIETKAAAKKSKPM